MAAFAKNKFDLHQKNATESKCKADKYAQQLDDINQAEKKKQQIPGITNYVGKVL